MGLRTLHRVFLIVCAGVVLAAMVAVMPATATTGSLQLAVSPKVPAAQAASTKLYVYPPTAHPYGHSYTQWAVHFFQWWAAIPASQNPWLDKSGAHCAQGQSGPVWYLLNGIVNGTTVRACTVPAGKALIIDDGLGECSTVEGNGTTFQVLRACVKSYGPATKAYVTVDGVRITNVVTSYQFWTPLYTFNYPAGSIFSTPNGKQVPGSGTSKSVGEVWMVILAPLGVGQHTVELYTNDPHLKWVGDVTYHLTVRG